MSILRLQKTFCRLDLAPAPIRNLEMSIKMKTATLEVKGLFEVLDHFGVQRRIEALPGVLHAHASPASMSVTVHYDGESTGEATLRNAVRACGYHCRGEMQPDHVREFPAPGLQAAQGLHAAQPGSRDEMAHDMGHAAGMDMAGMVRDMRNRFFTCLAFTIPLFFWAPMGLPIPTPVPPFGLELDKWLFVLASGAVLWPSWPFFIAAWRALRNGVLNMAVLVPRGARRQGGPNPDRRGDGR